MKFLRFYFSLVMGECLFRDSVVLEGEGIKLWNAKRGLKKCLTKLVISSSKSNSSSSITDNVKEQGNSQFDCSFAQLSKFRFAKVLLCGASVSQ